MTSGSSDGLDAARRAVAEEMRELFEFMKQLATRLTVTEAYLVALIAALAVQPKIDRRSLLEHVKAQLVLMGMKKDAVADMERVMELLRLATSGKR